MDHPARGVGPAPPFSKEKILDAGRASGLIRRWLELARDEDFFVVSAAGPGPPNPASDAPRVGSGTDVTTAALDASGPPHDAARRVRAELRLRCDGVLAGGALVPDVIHVFGPRNTTWRQNIADGAHARAGASAGALEGPLAEILVLERTVLNIVGRLSGIATRTACFVEQVAFTRAIVTDTRKTTPGMRVAEKYAVACGGGANHRMSLADAVLVKDNHLAGIPDDRLAAFVRTIVDDARAAAASRRACGGAGLAFIEIEVDRLDQLRAILDAGGCGVDIILLDNFDDDGLTEAVRLRNARSVPVAFEASGGITLERVAAVARTGVDRISVGSLTHGAASLDVGLDIEGG